MIEPRSTTAERTIRVLLFNEMWQGLKHPIREKSHSLREFLCDLAGSRTQDPLLKREMLYLLSYQVCAFTPANI